MNDKMPTFLFLINNYWLKKNKIFATILIYLNFNKIGAKNKI